MRRKFHMITGYTLSELMVTFIIISITAAIVYPFVAPRDYSRQRRAQCMGNLKQIGMAALAYAQDNDGTLPPTAAAEPLTSGDAALYGKSAVEVRLWLMQFPLKRVTVDTVVSCDGGATNGNGFLTPYVTNEPVLRCPPPDPTNAQGKVPYMANDLAGAARLDTDFSNRAATVLVMDGQDVLFPVGHALGLSATHQPGDQNWATWDWKKRTVSQGGFVDEAAYRHKGGADYLLADGHVKWYKPQDVFFPPRNSSLRSHFDQARNKMVGPNPFGTMCYNDGPYPEGGPPFKATFHLR